MTGVKLAPGLIYSFSILLVMAVLLGDNVRDRPSAFLATLLITGSVSLATWLASRGLADEVLDLGDHLRVRQGPLRVVVPLGNIFAVKAFGSRLTLHLRRPGQLGWKIAFIPRRNTALFSLGSCEVADDLGRLVEQLRRMEKA